MAFKKQPNPTFKAFVEVHVPGQVKPEKVEFEFKHVKNTQWEKLSAEKSVRDVLIDDVVLGWSIPDEAFSKEALIEVFDNYPSVVMAVFETFVNEMFSGKARQKN